MDKLQRLRQGSMSVDEYTQQMELLLLRVGLREEEKTSIVRFLSGLNTEVRDKVELLPYMDLDELVQFCIRVEQQLKRILGDAFCIRVCLLQNLMAFTLIQGLTKPKEFWGLHFKNPRKIRVRP